MSRYKFSPAERFAVYETHGEKCYLCGKPIDLKTFEVDHIIPEKLLDDSSRLKEVCDALGRPADFSVNSYANWMPACRPCNGKKQAAVFEPTPIIQVILQTAATRSERAASLAQKTVKKAEIAKALNLLERANEFGELDDIVKAALLPLVDFQLSERAADLADEPIRLSPSFVVHAHRHSSHHREQLLASELCGCFFCLKVFSPSLITAWTDGSRSTGVTALCPFCGIDSIIGSKSGYPVTTAFLQEMKAHWFGGLTP